MTLAEYMRELVLMKRQYGQEEELYPLINMLLRYKQDGNENDDKKKNDNLKENMKHLSLRQVANAVRIKEDETRNLMMGYGSFPDFTILDEGYGLNNKKMYGCVEVKAVSDPLFKFDNDSFTINSSDLVQIVQKANMEKSRGKTSTYYYTLSKEIEEIIENKTVELEVNEVDGEKSFRAKKIIDENKKVLKIEDVNKEVLTTAINSLIDKDTTWHKSNTIGVDITQNESNRPFIEAYLDNIAQGDIVEIKVFPGGGLIINTGKEKMPDAGEYGLGQLISELLWYGKVLYTNGLIWKYIELKSFPVLTWDEEDEVKKDENEDDRITLYKNCINKPDSIRKSYWRNKLDEKTIKIRCVEIGNLEEVFNTLYNDLEKTEEINIDNIEISDGANKAWKRLNDNLSKIKWTESNVNTNFV